MPAGFNRIAFTPAVQAHQARDGSRKAYARFDGAQGATDTLGMAEARFITARDSFYMASVNADGWPYIQHRGGPRGFLRVLNENEVGFADFSGNRQFVSVGNLESNNRVSLFLMDYPNRARLKMFGRARVVDPADTAMLDRLVVPGYKARVQRGMVVTLEGFDWNCPQHITPRFTLEEIKAMSEA